MISQPFKVNHLCASFAQRMQQHGFSCAGATTDRDVLEALRQLRQFGGDARAIRFIAAFKLHRLEPDLPQHQGQRARASTAAPTINERRPIAWFVREVLLQHVSDAPRHQRRAHALRGERRHLFVHGADARTLVVVEHRVIHRAGDKVFSVFAFGARVDDVCTGREKSVELIGGDGAGVGNVGVYCCGRRHFSNFANAGQTVSSNAGCAAAVG